MFVLKLVEGTSKEDLELNLDNIVNGKGSVGNGSKL